MLSKVLPDTTVIPSYRSSMSALPLRARSAAVKPLNAHSEFNSASSRWPNRFSNDEDISPYHRRETTHNNSSFNIDEYSDEEELYNSSSGYYLQPKNAPSVYDVVRAKNTNERLNELEKTNLNLRRMLSMISQNQEQERIGSAKLLTSRETYQSKLGPPLLRQGRIGSTWRHIKQTNNYTNNNLLFIDGTVRINDSARYPPRVYGYPPKQVDQRENYSNSREFDREMLGLNSQSINNMDFPVDSVRNRPLNLSAYENPFHSRAKQGFEYWTKDKRNPENNKNKAKLYTTGAYKTFYGLSDSLLKT